MNGIEIFSNDEFGEFRMWHDYFVGKDIAKILGYSNPQKALRDHVDADDKTVNDSFTVNGTTPILINESGLYSLILKSKLPEAKKFKHWVTSEVLPSIRKTGAYMTDETLEQALTSPDFLIKLATQLKEEKEKRKMLEVKVAADKPKVTFANALITNPKSITVGSLAKLMKQNGIDIGQNKLYEWLRNKGFLMKRYGKDYNLPTQRGMEQGLFEIKETPFYHSDGTADINCTTLVTTKGQMFFINKFIKGA